MIGIDIRGFRPKWWAGLGIGRTSKQLSRGFLVFLLIFTTSSSASFFLRKMLVIVCDK